MLIMMSTAYTLFFDGLWLRLINKGEDFESDVILNKIIALKDERNWCLMAHDYLNNYYNHTIGSPPYRFLQLVKNCEHLVKPKTEESTYTLIHEYYGTRFLQEIIFKDNCFVFQLPSENYFVKQLIFFINAMKDDDPDTFCMRQFAADTILEHQSLEDHEQLPNLHFALLIDGRITSTIYPLSWCGNPTRDKEKTFWEWGYMRSQDTKPVNMLLGEDGTVPWKVTKNVSQQFTYRIVCYQID